MGFSLIRDLLYNLDDITFLSTLDKVDFYDKGVFVKRNIWNYLISVIGIYVEIRSQTEFHKLVRIIKSVFVQRLSRVSTRSFRLYFEKRIHSAFSVFRAAVDRYFIPAMDDIIRPYVINEQAASESTTPDAGDMCYTPPVLTQNRALQIHADNRMEVEPTRAPLVQQQVRATDPDSRPITTVSAPVSAGTRASSYEERIRIPQVVGAPPISVSIPVTMRNLDEERNIRATRLQQLRNRVQDEAIHMANQIEYEVGINTEDIEGLRRRCRIALINEINRSHCSLEIARERVYMNVYRWYDQDSQRRIRTRGQQRAQQRMNRRVGNRGLGDQRDDSSSEVSDTSVIEDLTRRLRALNVERAGIELDSDEEP